MARNQAIRSARAVRLSTTWQFIGIRTARATPTVREGTCISRWRTFSATTRIRSSS
ncbi:MAG: hypothetical protein KJ060_09865 [Candidatus Hydrogenedentes bacterium]|nr:hypothetical protein [Candidatus Hydrogenedentota bacterium]